MSSEKNKKTTPVSQCIRAAEYVRMSTEHQKYSTENQSDVIKEYAYKHNMEIVRTYADEGKSGLKIHGRDALRQLIDDVRNGQADFKVILVYDISRWGRFQDADESAYYEYICKRAGISVEYCAEQFTNDGSMGSTLLKQVKRTMAGEYSRELSAKVFKGQCRLIQLGFRQGGHAGYGLRRVLVDEEGNQKGILKQGELKSLQTDRVILKPGPKEEVETVQWMYSMFVQESKSETEIAAILNSKNKTTDFNRMWKKSTVHQVLSNEKYIGNNVYNRQSFKLKKKHVRNPPNMWVRAEGVFDAIVDHELFYTARGIILERSRRYSNDEMISLLGNLYERQGRLSGFMIDEMDNMPSSSAYRNRFGSLIRAYKLVGYTPETDYSYIEINKQLRKMHPFVVDEVITGIRKMGATVFEDEPTGVLVINGEFSASLVLSRCTKTKAGSLRWNIRLENASAPDIIIAVRMNTLNDKPLDYYLLPLMDMKMEKLRLSEDNEILLDAYRFDTLDHLFGMTERVKIEVAV